MAEVLVMDLVCCLLQILKMCPEREREGRKNNVSLKLSNLDTIGSDVPNSEVSSFRTDNYPVYGGVLIDKG